MGKLKVGRGGCEVLIAVKRETGLRGRTWQVFWTLSDFGVESGKAGPPRPVPWTPVQTAAARLQCRANIFVGYPLT